MHYRTTFFEPSYLKWANLYNVPHFVNPSFPRMKFEEIVVASVLLTAVVQDLHFECSVTVSYPI